VRRSLRRGKGEASSLSVASKEHGEGARKHRQYFAKYLGKPLEGVREPIPGRWWGKVNSKALPVAERLDTILSARASVLAHRLVRKLLQKRADAAKHYTMARKLTMVGFNKEPLLSQFGMIAMKGGHLSQKEARFGEVMTDVAKFHGKRWGKSRKRGFGKFSKIRLISNSSPATAIQIISHVMKALEGWIDDLKY